MPYLRVEAGNRITIPDDIVRQLGLKPGQMVEVRFPAPVTGRGLGTTAQWRHLANQRLDDATVLLVSRKRRYNGAVYLGGYAIECSLKAAICILKNLPTLPEEYKTHALDDLLTAAGLKLPNHLVRKFLVINSWSVDIRYQASTWKAQDAKKFLEYVREVKQWIEMETLPG
ncbi:HEPN domain-containing protein [Candidatus Poribacteria bacterium]|nr:HEPN domain-containing protein [Candidatus Poribacteria bacterium]